MRSTPTENEVRADLELAFSLLPEGDGEARVRLMTVQAFWAFAFREREFTDEEVDVLSRTALEAADMALRLRRTDLASGALDAASGSGVTTGRYGVAAAVSERRIALVPELNDVGEVGDIYATSAWLRYEMGEYEEALRLATLGIEAMEEQAVNFELHCLAWRAVARFRLGDWDGTLADVERCRVRLGDRADAPPYFASPPFAIAALIALARGDDAESDRLLEMLLPLERTDSGTFTRLLPLTARLLVERRDLQEARARLVPYPPGWRVHAGQMIEARCELVSAEAAWDDTAEVVADARAYSEAGGLKSLLPFADRLEGVAAIAVGRKDDGLERLRRASRGFAALGAVWEQARTDLRIAAEAEGSSEVASGFASGALRTFERLGCSRDATRARALAGGEDGGGGPSKLG
jgi:tetratricopeptide (TPR) repeat protein